MKHIINIFTVYIIACIIGYGCNGHPGNSSSDISEIIYSMPVASLNFSNVGSALGQIAFDMQTQISTELTTITSTILTPSIATIGGQFGILSYNKPTKELIIKPAYMKSEVLRLLNMINKLQASSGCGFTPVITDTSTTTNGITNVNIVWKWNDLCSFSTGNFAITGTTSWSGNYNVPSGSLALSVTYDITDASQFTTGTEAATRIYGTGTFTGTGLIKNSQGVYYKEQIPMNISGYLDTVNDNGNTERINTSIQLNKTNTITGTSSMVNLTLEESSPENQTMNFSNGVNIAINAGTYLITNSPILVGMPSTTTIEYNGEGLAGYRYNVIPAITNETYLQY